MPDHLSEDLPRLETMDEFRLKSARLVYDRNGFYGTEKPVLLMEDKPRWGGGEGSVSLAWDPILEVYRVVKTFHPTGMPEYDEELRSLLEREAKMQARAGGLYERVVPVISLIEDPEIGLMVVMPLIGGVTMKQVMDSYRSKGEFMPDGEVLELTSDVGDALNSVYKKKMLHRDVKPGNVLISEFGPLLFDFGVGARLMVSVEREEEGIAGTPGFMPPEAYDSDNSLDIRSDLWSLGAVVFEMVTGRRPFEAETPYVLMKRVIDGDLPNVSELRPGLDEEVVSRLNVFFAKALAKNKNERFQTPGEFVEGLRVALGVEEGEENI